MANQLLEYAVAELQRIAANLLRVGVIEDVDYTKCTAKVRLGENLTTSLKWGNTRANSDVVDWSPPKVGEQVLVGSPNGALSSGFILSGGIYYDSVPAPSSDSNVRKTSYADGAEFEYNLSTSTLTVKGVDKVVIESASTLSVTCPSMEFDGQAHFTGKVTSDVDFEADGIKLTDHVHTGVQSGESTTGGPQ